MNFVSNEYSMQSYKQQLQYETKVSFVESNPELEKSKKDLDASVIPSSMLNAPVVYSKEEDLPMADKIKKMLMQSILGGFSKEGDPAGLFPNDSMQMNKEHFVQNNPYSESASQIPNGFLYQASSEYYEKTTIEFNAQATIKTPQGEYQIEINFSYTEEFYEKHETQISYAQSHFEKPFEINLPEDDESLKHLKRLDLLFDIIKEDNEKEKSLMDEIKKILFQRQQLILKTLDEKDNNGVNPANDVDKTFDNFRVFEKQDNEQNSLIALKKDGVGIFLSNSYSNSSYVSATVGPNGVSVQSGYSQQETTSVSMISDLKA